MVDMYMLVMVREGQLVEVMHGGEVSVVDKGRRKGERCCGG